MEEIVTFQKMLDEINVLEGKMLQFQDQVQDSEPKLKAQDARALGSDSEDMVKNTMRMKEAIVDTLKVLKQKAGYEDFTPSEST